MKRTTGMAWTGHWHSRLVSLQGSNAACSLALKPDCVVVYQSHSPCYESSSRLALGLDGSAINRHLSLETTPRGCGPPDG